MKKISTKKNWDNFWDRKQNVAEVYSNEDRIIRNLKKNIDLSGKRILEVGAGTARDSFNLSCEGATVYVLDYSQPALDIVQKLNDQTDCQVLPLLADTFHIPARNESFDIVYHQGLLEHFRDPVELLNENIRVLKTDGYLLIDVPQRYHYYTLIKHFLIAINKWFAGWETEFSIDQLTKLVESLDLKVIDRYGDWKRPSIFYRIMREILLKVSISIPLYPKTWEPLRKIRDYFREKFRKTKMSFYTYLDIGVIARKVNHDL
ncbi:class I SAM-dependent methyltransferase [candidate division KSB1 bacterium]|nr:class I SAM-dependent methyltransferase [candidate division KSB1 bacterium]